MEFGYNPPSGERGYEKIRPREYLTDLHRALDVASQSFGSLWTSDHLNYTTEFRVECWTLLTWMAARYPGPMLGTVVMSNSFRSPSLMAKMAASFQELSYGRLILGYGAGWYEPEYRSYGFDYPSAGTRIAQFDEGVRVMKAMWTDAPASFDGKYYKIENVHCEPRPDPPPILMLGGGGERKTLAPRFYVHRTHAKALELAGDRMQSDQPPIAGDPSSVTEQLMQLVEMGFDFSVATFPRFQELDDMKLFVDEVMPHFS